MCLRVVANPTSSGRMIIRLSYYGWIGEPVQHEPKFLSADQFLITTLIVTVAVAAILTTMLVRFRWFRRILLTERRDWPERLVFAAGLGIPLCAGVVARLLLNYNALDLSLSGSFLAG